MLKTKLMSMLLMLCWILGQADSSDAVCQCRYFQDEIRDDAYIGTERKINCCVSGANHIDVNRDVPIVWTFEGQPTELGGRLVLSCNNESLTITNVLDSDNGKFTCTFTTITGNKLSLSTYLTVHPEPVAEAIKDVKVLTDKESAEEGDDVSFTCEASVGKINPDDLSVYWHFVQPDGTAAFLPDGVTETELEIGDDGIMQSKIEIKSVKTKHFGTYFCTVSNSFDTPKAANASLIKKGN